MLPDPTESLPKSKRNIELIKSDTAEDALLVRKMILIFRNSESVKVGRYIAASLRRGGSAVNTENVSRIGEGEDDATRFPSEA